MNCAKCGYQNKENAAFCSNCGAKINSSGNIDRNTSANSVSAQNNLADMSPGQDKIVIAIADGSLYEKADVKSYVLREIERGDKLTLTGKQGNLYQVKKRIGFDAELIGYVEGKVIRENTINDGPTANNLQTASALVEMTPDLYKTAVAINNGSLYEKPDTNSYVLREIERGDKLTLTGKQGNLYQVKKRIGFDAELTGFIEAKLIEEKPITYKIKRVAATLNGAMFAKPDITAVVLTQVHENDKFIVLDETKEFYHVKLESNNSIAGYIERDLINSRRAVISSNGQMFVNPDFTSEAVCEVFKGDVVLILSEINEYYHVKLGADRTISGYIGKDLLAPPQETKKPAAEIPAATSAVTTDAFYNATSNKTNYYTNNLSTPYRRVVNRPGLLSFVGYTFAVIGWIGIVCGVIGLLVAIVAGCQASQYGNTIQDIAVGIPAVIGGVILLGGSIFASAGMGVLKGGQVARVFAILLSLLFIPTILFTILFLIGLLNHDASDYFDYCNK